MSLSNEIYLGTSRSLRSVGEYLSTELGLRFGEDDRGGFYLVRPLRPEPVAALYGTLTENYEEPGLEIDGVSVMDGYPVLIILYLEPRDDDDLRAQSKRLFDEICRITHWPALLTGEDQLLAASLPNVGMLDVPPGTSVDSPGREGWAPLVLNRSHLAG